MPIKGKKTYYEYFGLENFESDPDKIKRAWRSKCLQVHPDRNEDKETATKNMQLANDVYNTLTKNKSVYDRYLIRQGVGGKKKTKQKASGPDPKFGPGTEFAEKYGFTFTDNPTGADNGTAYGFTFSFNDLNDAAENLRRTMRQQEHDREKQMMRRAFIETLTDGEFAFIKKMVEEHRSMGKKL